MKAKLLTTSPKILVVSTSQDLLNLFSIFTQAKREDVFEFEFLLLVNSQPKLSQLEYYKVLWLVDTFDVFLSFESERYQKIKQFFSAFNLPINLTLFLPDQLSLKNKKLSKLNFYLKKTKEFVDRAFLEFNQPQIFLGSEVVDVEFNYITLSTLAFFLKRVDQGVVLCPDTKVNYLTSDDFFKTVLTFLKRPHQSRKILIRGRPKLKSAGVFFNFKRLYEFYYKEEILIKKTKLNTYLDFKKADLVVVESSFKVKFKVLLQHLKPKGVSRLKIFFNRFEKEKKESLDDGFVKKKTKRQEEKVGFNLEEDVLSKVVKVRKKELRFKKKRLFKIELKGLKKNKRRKTLFYSGLFMLILGVVSLVAVGVFNLSFYLFQHDFRQQLTDSTTESHALSLKSSLKDRFLLAQAVFFEKMVDGEQFKAAHDLVRFKFSLIELVNVQAKEAKLGQKLVKNVFQTGDLNQTVAALTQVNTQVLSLIKSLTSQVDIALTGLEAGRLEKDFLLNQLKQLKKENLVISKVLPLISGLLGKEKEKTYLLVYQDDHELRTTGGVIQLVAVVSFNQGRLVGYKFYEPGEIARRLGGVVEAPDGVKRYLSEPSWQLTDATWGEVGESAGQNLVWFATKALGVKPDGVVFINNHTLKSFLQIVSQVELKRFNEVVVAKNLDEKLLFYDSVYADKPRNEFVLALVKSVFEKLIQTEDAFNKLARTLYEQLSSQQLTLSQFSTPTQKVFNQLSWSSGVLKLGCPSLFINQACLIDGLYQLESNVGVNKANYFLTRRIKHQISFTEREIKHKRVVEYANLSKSNVWPKGDYIFVVKFYLPKGAEGVRLRFGGKDVGVTIRRGGERVEVESEKLVVPISQTKKLTLLFTVPEKLTSNSSYLFLDQNQSGSKDDVYDLTIINNLKLKPKLIAPQAEMLNNLVRFRLYQNKNLLFGLKF